MAKLSGIVAFVGFSRAGKSTFVRLFNEKWPDSEAIHEFEHIVIREYDGTIYKNSIRRCENAIERSRRLGHVLLTTCCCRGEIKFIKNAGGTIVLVNRPGVSASQTDWMHLREVIDFVIENVESVEYYRERLRLDDLSFLKKYKI